MGAAVRRLNFRLADKNEAAGAADAARDSRFAHLLPLTAIARERQPE